LVALKNALVPEVPPECAAATILPAVLVTVTFAGEVDPVLVPTCGNATAMLV
jgi:hypothetical protein